jgi:hypothetical protein
MTATKTTTATSNGNIFKFHSSPSNNKQHGAFCYGQATAMATHIDFQTKPAHTWLAQSVICHSTLSILIENNSKQFKQ